MQKDTVTVFKIKSQGGLIETKHDFSTIFTEMLVLLQPKFV